MVGYIIASCFAIAAAAVLIVVAVAPLVIEWREERVRAASRRYRERFGGVSL
jgi:hypothetical protein